MKRLIITFALLFITICANAQTNQCKVLLDKIAGKYTGECLNGLANGKGKAIGEDTYTGTFKDGLPDGKGKYLYKNGDLYQGHWLNGEKSGKGKFVYKINSKKNTLTGYWENNEYVGVTPPNTPYRVTSTTGIMNYKVEKSTSTDERNKKVTFSIKSAFTDFAPSDLKIEKSSGQINQLGKKFTIDQYFSPLFCEVSYTIVVADTRKQCRFIIEILDDSSYSITLSND
ncbi:hypothetical protein [Flammeovirga sp. SJP92]|uniref:hypothetical protein n=1 Tax=Flammeovirga sp. SJP92 TaxID=1775430 RepID=UPI001560BD9E|nr:hypothetical protein [Flammeovirga sp. SJP92]